MPNRKQEAWPPLADMEAIDDAVLCVTFARECIFIAEDRLYHKMPESYADQWFVDALNWYMQALWTNPDIYVADYAEEEGEERDFWQAATNQHINTLAESDHAN